MSRMCEHMMFEDKNETTGQNLRVIPFLLDENQMK